MFAAKYPQNIQLHVKMASFLLTAAGRPNWPVRPQERCPALQNRAWAVDWPISCMDQTPHVRSNQWQHPFGSTLEARGPIGERRIALPAKIGRNVFIQWYLNTWRALLHAETSIGQSSRAEPTFGLDGANESEGRLILHRRGADGSFPRWGVCLCYYIFGKFKGKGSVPQRRQSYVIRAEILEQRVYCVREKEIET